ncbi:MULTISPECIES: hypothetical protein [Serratia]|nr:hypothetical protein [Serratia marcescens]MDS0825392.1 hypothetical protein [Serratia marcescens]
MTNQRDYQKVFELLDQMEACVNKVRELNESLGQCTHNAKAA